MGRRIARRGLLGIISTVFATTLLIANAAAEGFPAALPQQPLADALEAFANATGYQLVYRAELAAGLTSEGADAGLSAADTMRQLLRGTGLVFEFVNDRTIAIFKSSDHSTHPSITPGSAPVRPETKTRNNDGAASAVIDGSNDRGDQKVIHRGLMVRLAAFLGLCVSAAASGTACAQTADAANAGESEAGTAPALEEIVVTAQRRQENLQNVPIVVSQVSADDLARVHLESLEYLDTLVPGLSITNGYGGSAVFLRGIGTASLTVGNEQSVATYVDGVYYVKTYPAIYEVNDIQSVEVLKGPQGTLFGRNASGGVINITTRDPTDRPTLEGSIGYGDFQTTTGSVYASGGLGDDIRGNVAVTYRDQAQGWGENITLGQDVDRDRYISARSKWIFTPTQTTTVRVSADFINGHTDIGLVTGLPYQGTTAGNSIGPPAIYGDLPDFYDTRNARPSFESTEEGGLSARIEQQLPFAQFISTTAYRKVETTDAASSDTSGLDFGYGLQHVRANQVSQELQLSSKTGAPVEWDGGLYFLRSTDAYVPTQVTGLSFGGGGIAFFAKQVVSSYAGYGQGTLHFTSQTALTLGLRYTRDDIRADGQVALLNAAANGTFDDLFISSGAASTSQAKPTWRVALEHNWTDQIMSYASTSRGFKSGEFNTLPFSPTPLLPEVLQAYEIGTKSQFGGRLKLNAAAYWYNYTNLQVQQFVATGGVESVQSINAASARIKGVDLDTEFIVTTQLSTHASLAYIDSRFLNFEGALSTRNNTALVNGYVPGCTVPATQNLNPLNGGNVDSCGIDAAGNRLPNAPTISGTVGLTYELRNVIGGDWTYSADFEYRASSFAAVDNYIRLGDRELLNSSIRYAFPNQRLSILVWARNLTNQHYLVGVGDASGYRGFQDVVGEPRTFGVTLSAKL